MGDLHFQPELLAQIADRLDLRGPNRDAIESVVMETSQHYDVDENTDPYECIVDSATGVGKTYVMAGLVEYFAGADRPARNFLLLAPGRTIRDKSVKNFTPGNGKSLTKAMASRPYLVTSENFNSPATKAVMDDPSRTKLYVFTVQALTSEDGEGRATHKFQQWLGCSFFEYLAALDDLVILADEHHCYRGPAFSKTIKKLQPELVVGVTATPAKADLGLVAFRYPLAAAIADRLVKTPILVARRDDRTDTETKLLDGVTLLRYKERFAHAYCDENDIPRVNPVMLVIARDINEAQEFQRILDSAAFDGGAWVGKTLLVHSKLTGDEKERALADLEAVEDPDSKVRIIISVGMLKEGWDVKNVYVIASMRASVSDVLTEQTLGRGMRLPFGDYTDHEILDTVEVLAHEKYEQLLQKRDVLNQAFIDHKIRAQARLLSDGTTVVRRAVTEETRTVLGTTTVDGTTSDVSVEPTGVQASGDTAHVGVDNLSPTAAAPANGVVDLSSRTEQMEASAATTTDDLKQYMPLIMREPIALPYVKAVARPADVTLNAITDYTPFTALGTALGTDLKDDLVRTKISATRTQGGIRLDPEKAEDTIKVLTLDIPLEESRKGLRERVMGVKGVTPRATEVGAATRIVGHVIDAMGDDAGVILSAYFDRCAQRLERAVSDALTAATTQPVVFDDKVCVAPLSKERGARRREVDGHPDGGFDRQSAFDGWEKNLYSHSWFDTLPEYKAASAIDAGKNVIVWARLHINDIPITWNMQGQNYNPDFAVVEDVEGKRICWLVETKRNKDITTDEVAGKRRAAKTWANTVNSSGEADGEWRYLLLSEDDVNDARGSWEQMKGFGQ